MRFTTTTLNGYGYANPLCYCELFLLLPALLYNLWLPLRTCYQIYLFAVTLATCAIAYYSFAKIAASRRLGLLGALLYTCPATGSSASTPAPLRANSRPWPSSRWCWRACTASTPGTSPALPIGFPCRWAWRPWCRAICSLCELTALLLILFCLLRLQETLRPRAAGLGQGRTAGRGVERVVSGAVLPLHFVDSLHGQWPSDRQNSVPGPLPDTAVQPFYNGFAGADAGTNPDMMLSLGLPLILGLGLVVFCLLRRRDAQGQAASILTTAAGFFCADGVLALHIFPWDYVQTTLGRTAGKLAGLFQYPWRFLSLATVLLCLAVIMAVKLLTARDRRLGLTATVVLAAAALFMTGAMQAQMLNGQREVSYNVFSYENPTSCIGVGSTSSTAPAPTRRSGRSPSRAAMSCTWSAMRKTGRRLRKRTERRRRGQPFRCLSLTTAATARPTKTTNPLPSPAARNERIVLTIPANYTGTVRVWYQAPGFWRVFEVISALSLLGTVGVQCVRPPQAPRGRYRVKTRSLHAKPHQLSAGNGKGPAHTGRHAAKAPAARLLCALFQRDTGTPGRAFRHHDLILQPNIYPPEEYHRREAELERFVEEAGYHYRWWSCPTTRRSFTPP